MNLIRCEMGHFYDADTHSICPHCNGVEEEQSDVTVAKQTTIPNTTVMMDAQSLEDAVNNARGEDEDQKTIGFYGGTIGIEPVVGWLVCTEGQHYGEDFKIKTGRNFIGRSSNMDIVLFKDQSISRERHAIILFEPKNNLFLVQPGDSRELFYVNGNVVLSALEIKAYDEIALGATKLKFIPFCNEEFNWNNSAKE